jgi:lysozyme family protein
MFGITERVARAHGYQGDMHALPIETAKAIAKSEYWGKFQCDQFDPRIGYLVFDAAFNGGHPAQWMQAAAGVTVDGSIGAQTIAAVRAVEPWKIMARFNASHAEYYASLRNFTMIDGWVNRIAYNLRLGAQ